MPQKYTYVIKTHEIKRQMKTNLAVLKLLKLVTINEIILKKKIGQFDVSTQQ